MVQFCNKTFYPGDIKSFGLTHPAFALLQKGYEVSFNAKGWIVDARDPRTDKLYASDGSEVGTRNKPFESRDQPEVRTDVRKKYTPSQKGDFVEGSDIWNALNAGRNVTLNEKGIIVEIRDPATGKLYDNLGNETGKVVTSGYPESYAKEVKNPLIHTDTPDDISMYDPEHWIVGHLQEGRHVTVNDKGDILDIWDPKTGKQYDADHNEIGTRTDPYPSDNNMEGLKGQIDLINAQIRALRAARAGLRGAARYALSGQISALSAQRGHVLFQWGRLLGRRRRMDQAYDRKRTEGN